MANLKYPTGKRAILGGTGGPIDWDTDTLHIMLVNQTYRDLSDATKKGHDFYDDVSANEVSGTGYTAGGQALAGASIASDGADGYFITFTDPAWPSATITAWGAVIFKKVGGTFGADDPLLLFLDFGAAVSSTNGTFTVDIPGTGLYVLP
jgi:hypothetical protein